MVERAGAERGDEAADQLAAGWASTAALASASTWRELGRRGLVDEAEGQGDAAAAGASARLWISRSSNLVLAMMTCSPLKRAQAGGLEADPLDRAGGGVEADRVAAAERAVEHDRQRGEQVGENALRGKADGDAADAEPGDQAR